jgi:DnaJ family protein A protein 2
LPEDATLEDLKLRYHQLAMEHHPDRGGDPEKFKGIEGAYREVSGMLGEPS